MKIKLLLISILSLLCFINYAECSEKHRHKHKHKHRHHHKHRSKKIEEHHHHYHYYDEEPVAVCTPYVPVVQRSVVYHTPVYRSPSFVEYRDVYPSYERVYSSRPSFSFNAVYY